MIGPKGSGKTYLGRLLQARLAVGFVDVEAVFRGLPDPTRVSEGYDRVAGLVAERLQSEPAVSLELTGAAPETAGLLDGLGRIGTLRRVRVTAPLELCLARIAHRDADVHLPASEEVIRKVHAISDGLELAFDLTIESGRDDEETVLRRVADLL